MHGIGGNRRNWYDQIDAFAPHFHAVAWDARGYGDSDDYDGPLDFQLAMPTIWRGCSIISAPTRAHVIGLSMGGRIAMDFAARYPDRAADADAVRHPQGLCRIFRGEEKGLHCLAQGAAARRQGAEGYRRAGGAHAGRPECHRKRPSAAWSTA